jgi:diphthamide biosynthesis methyltransferase
VLRAKEVGVPFQVVHNTSILNAVGCCGLQVKYILINNGDFFSVDKKPF